MTKKLKPGPKVGADGPKKTYNMTLKKSDINEIDSLVYSIRSIRGFCSRGFVVSALLKRHREDPIDLI